MISHIKSIYTLIYITKMFDISSEENDFDQQKIRNSKIMRNARQKKNQEKQVDAYSHEVIEQSMMKSYIIQMATHKKKNVKIKKGWTDDKTDKGGMTRSKIVKPQAKLFGKVFQNIKSVQRMQFHIENHAEVPKKLSFECCGIMDRSQICFLKFRCHKQLQIVSQKGQLKYSFNFNTIEAKVRKNHDKNSDGFILLVSPQIKLLIQCPKNLQFEDLARKKIKDMIKDSDGKLNNLEDLPIKNSQFYKRRYKTAVEFADNCKTGDILLFQGSHFFANVQRFITNSDFDHVGMVIRDPVYGILIFQSNSTTGVCLTPWQYLIRYEWYDAIEKIVWRQLEGIDRDSDFDLLIHEFVKANLGKNYFISIDKLISNKSFIGKNDEQIGYFCSELVAKVYKDLGLLTRNRQRKEFKPSNNFYPYHFTEKYQMELTKGSLSKEYQIYFNKERLKEYYQF